MGPESGYAIATYASTSPAILVGLGAWLEDTSYEEVRFVLLAGDGHIRLRR